MKNRNRKTLLFMLVLVLALIMPLAGCNNLEEEIGEDLTEGLIKGLTGGNAELDIESGEKWPEDMPAKVPEFKKGNIDISTNMTIGSQTQISVLINNVEKEDVADYVTAIENSEFTQIMYADADGNTIASYAEGDNALTFQYDESEKEMFITYTGN